MRQTILSSVLLITAILMLSSGCDKKKVEPDPNTSVVELNVNDIISHNFVGNGVQWSAYPDYSYLMTDEKWQIVFDRLDFMQPQLIRLMVHGDLRYRNGDFERNFAPVKKLLQYCQDNSIDVTFGEWGPSVSNANILDDDFTDDEAWLDLDADYLEFLVKTHGFTCIKSYILYNEPNGDWSSVKGKYAVWERLIKSFHGRLVEKGLDKTIAIAGPDAAFFNNSSETNSWVRNTYNNLDSIIGLYNIHAYIGQEYVRSKSYSDFFKNVVSIPEESNKPFIMGELGFKYYDEPELDAENIRRAEADGYAAVEDCNMFVYDFSYGIDMADVCLQSMNIGFDGMVAWDLDDAMHLYSNTTGKPQLKRWGFWNILGDNELFGSRPEDTEMRPWYYTWSLLCRYFPKGSEIIKTVDLGKKGLSYVVARHNKQYSIAVVNSFYKTYDFKLKFDISTKLDFKKYIYTEENSPVDENNFPIPAELLENIDMENGISITAPSNCFILYTTMEVDK